MSPLIAASGVENATLSNVSPSFYNRTLGDVTNLSAVELRRKRDRERYASLSAEEREAKLKKNREYKQRKKDI
ncbi:hypothetical protein E2562_027852 [Oryza meyeriana var. granulata]|uniref:IBB domain-containing protein n=1 Tax=Oryza meyeriana var. granulata TaxID=110450 RepID=A0A6G1DN84_9ORYZ|nr:hypothetical protein E2562_027852 [Oryza meyeriana var. granulata]